MWNKVDFCLIWQDHFHFQHSPPPKGTGEEEEESRIQWHIVLLAVISVPKKELQGASKYAGVQIYYVFASSKECDTYHGILLDCFMDFQRRANFQHVKVSFRIKSKTLYSPNHYFQVKKNKMKILLRTWKYLSGKPSHKCLCLFIFSRNRHVQTGLLAVHFRNRGISSYQR